MKTMTVARLHKILSKAIADGCGRLPVCVNKETFTHNLEMDGCVVLPVNVAIIQSVVQIDDDGGTKVDSKGRECYRRNMVLMGDEADSEGAYERPVPPTPHPDLRAVVEAMEKALRHSAESQESVAAMLEKPADITAQGWKAAAEQLKKYAAEARALLDPKISSEVDQVG